MSDSPNVIPVGEITTRDIFNAVNDINNQMTVIKVGMEHITTRNTNADTIHTDHEARLRQLEAFKWKMVGLAAAIPFIEGVLTVLIAWKVK